MAENVKDSATKKVILKEEQVLVTGVRRSEKDGKVSYTLNGITPFNQYFLDNGSYGYGVVSEWTNRCDLSYLQVGDIVELQYGKGFEGKAILINCAKVGAFAF